MSFNAREASVYLEAHGFIYPGETLGLKNTLGAFLHQQGAFYTEVSPKLFYDSLFYKEKDVNFYVYEWFEQELPPFLKAGFTSSQAFEFALAVWSRGYATNGKETCFSLASTKHFAREATKFADFWLHAPATPFELAVVLREC